MRGTLAAYQLPFDLVGANSVEHYRAELPRSDVIIDGRGSSTWCAEGQASDIYKLISIKDQANYYHDVRQADMADVYLTEATNIEDRWADFFSTRRQVLSFRSPVKGKVHELEPGIVRTVGGISFHHLNDSLAKLGYAFPPVTKRELNQYGWSFIGERIDEALYHNYPTPYDQSLGCWADRILGFTLMLADGHTVRADRSSDWTHNGINLLECVLGTNGAIGFLLDVDIKVIPLSAAEERIPTPCLNFFNKFDGDLGNRGVYFWNQQVCPNLWTMRLRRQPHMSLASTRARAFSLVPAQVESTSRDTKVIASSVRIVEINVLNLTMVTRLHDCAKQSLCSTQKGA